MFCKRMIEILKEGLNLNKRRVTGHKFVDWNIFFVWRKGNTPLNSIHIELFREGAGFVRQWEISFAPVISPKLL